MPQHPIVVASDFSAHAEEALRYALRFWPAPVHLLHVAPDPPPYGTSADAARRAAHAGTARRDLEAALARAVDGLPGVEAVWRTAADPAEAITTYAAEVGAGLLVVGTQGRTGVSRLALGSVAEAVLQRASCAGLAVPLAADELWSDRPTRRVLCAVPLLASADRLAAFATSLARRLHAERPTFVHVIDPRPAARLREAAGGPVVLDDVEEALERLTVRFGLIETAEGRTDEAIVARADTLDADLIVVGTGQRRGIARALGSVASHVVRSARRPVLVVPPGAL